MELDPISTQVIISRLREVTETMAHALYHSGYSPILRESKDGTAGLTDPTGRVLSIGGGLQYHVLTYETAVRAVLERFPVAELRPDDVFLANDPYTVGTGHVPDMVVVAPVFHDDSLVGFGVSIAHKADVGGIVPGSSGSAATEIFHDGLRLTPVRSSSPHGIDPTIEAIVRANSRIPETVLGDLRGQIGATRLGARQLAALCDEYGRDTIVSACYALIDLTSAWLQREVRSLPDGEMSAQCIVDHAGSSPAIEMRVCLRKAGERLTIDFTGTSPQIAGPLNAVPTNICAAALLAVVATLDPTLPINSGLLGAVDFVVPEGTAVNPRPPASVNQYAMLVLAAYTCVLSAVGGFKPDRAVAPAGLGLVALAIGYPKSLNGDPDVQYELVDTSLGATSTHDGAAITGMISHYASGTPIEVLENEYPLRITRFDLRADSGGAGRHRGGVGYVREYEFLTDCNVNVRWTNRTHGSWGVAGGCAPALTNVVVETASGTIGADEMVTSCRLAAGNRLRIEVAGGGGYGPPRERPAAAVVEDVLDGYVSAEAAANVYGVTCGDDSTAQALS